MSDLPVEDENQIDAGAEEEIYACLNLSNPRSFFLYAGAGSGKTRSLVNAVNRLRRDHRRPLLLQGRRAAVITYTNAACDEIKKRLEFDPIVEVSTIHSFSWGLIQGFTTDIREWLRANLAKEILELQAASAKGRPGKAALDRARALQNKQRRLAQIDSITRFTYNPNGDNRGRDSLNHSEVIGSTSELLNTKPVLQSVLVSRYPVLFIDESQDTNKHLMEALLAAQKTHESCFCLGLFGDTMQRIYADGKAHLEDAIPENWATPAKKMNHRCPKRVIRLINRIRQDVDQHQQVPRTDKPEGTVRMFLLPNAKMDTPGREAAIAERMADIATDPGWATGTTGYKTLILEHHMAARRLGFEAMFSALSKAGRLRTSLLDGTLSGLRFFGLDILPVFEAAKNNDAFAIAEAVRRNSPLLSQKTLAALGPDQLGQLAKAKAAVDLLMKLWDEGARPTFLQVLKSVSGSNLFSVPDSLLTFTLETANTPEQAAPLTLTTEEEEDSEEQSIELAAWREFLETPFDQIRSYIDYVYGMSPFVTHQGVKGLEFPRVMVIVSDDEARGFLFSYEKLFGAKEKSATDLKHEAEGEETTIDRTRRLFYVTCSRAEASLAIVAYSENPDLVRERVLKEGWFDQSEVEILKN